jgi:hypothetical protein
MATKKQFYRFNLKMGCLNDVAVMMDFRLRAGSSAVDVSKVALCRFPVDGVRTLLVGFSHGIMKQVKHRISSGSFVIIMVSIRVLILKLVRVCGVISC